MYDDAAFYSIVHSSQYEQEEPVKISKHQRKPSLLAQPNENTQANGTSTAGLITATLATKAIFTPPPATVSQRAQSYTDFHHVARAVLESQDSVSRRANGQEKEIRNDLDFADWYEDLEDGLLEASDERYRSYLDQLKFTEAYLEDLSSQTSKSLGHLEALEKSFKSVEAQTSAFRKQCETLTTEQSRLEGLATDLGENLQYYKFLEPITRRFNAPGAGNLVRGQEFSSMLARLDECLEYMNTHITQREAPTYRSKYRLLLTRGLTLIRAHFSASLRDIAADVMTRIADKQLNDTTMSTLLYAKFRVGASELKELALEIKKRANVPVGATGTESGAETEYQNLMDELYTSYATTRGKLVLPLIRKKISEIAMAPSTTRDLVAFARTSIGYIKGVCADEFDLWREWFEGQDGLDDYLESVCEPLYDHLRPRIIHENQLVKLCELCTLLQTRYFHDQDDDGEVMELSNQLDFSALIQPALQDAQTRLVFRTQALLRDDIENFKPKPVDLDYPARNNPVGVSGRRPDGPVTSGRKSSLPSDLTIVKESVTVETTVNSNGKFEFDIEPTSQTWYPTLQKAIWLLSRIYRLVNSSVFDDLAHQIVHETTLSLHRAASLIPSKPSIMDSQLFLMKHLLLLKQQIVAFDIEYVTPDVSLDFSGVTNTFYELRDRGGLFDPRNLWRLVGGGLLPRVIENMLDAKAELDGRLRTIINDFTSAAASRITAAIAESVISKKNFAATDVVPAIQAAALREIPLLRRKLDEYLDDRRTRETLVGAVQDQVVLNYEAWVERWASETKRKAGGAKGKGREGDVWGPDRFAEWAVSTFRVGWGMATAEDEEAEHSDGSRSGRRRCESEES